MGIRRTEASFASNEQLLLFRRAWVPESPVRLIVLVHGFAEHSGRYEDIGAWLAARGAAVHAYDHRGHGRSDGRRNHVDRFDQFLDDLERFLAVVRSENPLLPITVVGHSMGGLIVSAFARERSPEVLAVVTSGAALAPDGSRSRARMARVLRKIVPTLSIDTGLSADALSRDPEVVERYLADPLIQTKATVSLGCEMLAAADRTAAGGAAVHVPMLLLHGGDDPLCAPHGSERFFESLGPLRDRSALRVYPGLRHEIFNEPEREEVFEEMLAWIRACEGAAEEPARASGLAVGRGGTSA